MGKPSRRGLKVLGGLLNFPFVDAACLAGEVDTYFIDGAPVVLKGLGVLLVFNLLKSLVRRFVELEFKDVNVLGCLDEHVDAPVGGVVLHLSVKTNHLENDPEGILEIEFCIACYLVVAASEERVEPLHELLNPPGTDVLDKVGDKRGPLLRRQGCIVGHKEAGESSFNL